MILEFFHKRFEFAILQNHSHKHALLFFRKSPHVCDKAFNSWCRFNFHHIQTTTYKLVHQEYTFYREPDSVHSSVQSNLAAQFKTTALSAIFCPDAT